MAHEPKPPPLPSRSKSSIFGSSTRCSGSGPYGPYRNAGALNDPRTSSTQSLVSEESNQRDRRKLLVIYIHGFRGTDASFQSLPAHIHHLVAGTLSDSHTVHTKVYPRYHTRGDMKTLAEEFSNWLTPHTSPTTDVVICGHSLGGALATEIVLLPPRPLEGRGPFRHRILGTIGFDAPYLGLHPHVVKYGIKSIFKPPEKPEAGPSSNASEQGSPHLGPQLSPAIVSDETNLMLSVAPDANYNPMFMNDIKLREPRAFMKNALHFIGKHSDNLGNEVKRVFKTHWEYTSGLSSYSTLQNRYEKVRALEEANEDRRTKATFGRKPVPRVRFANYYTASIPPRSKSKSRSRSRSRSKSRSRTGSPSGSHSRPPSSHRGDEPLTRGRSREEHHPTLDPSMSKSTPTLGASPRISLEEHTEGHVIPKEPQLPPEPSQNPTENASLADTSSLQDEKLHKLPSYDSITSGATTSENVPLSIPPTPQVPAFIDPSSYPDKESLKQAQKEYDQAVKTYKTDVKNRTKAIKAREKYDKKTLKDTAKIQSSPKLPITQPPQQQSQQEHSNDLMQAQKALAEMLLRQRNSPTTSEDNNRPATATTSSAPSEPDLTRLSTVTTKDSPPSSSPISTTASTSRNDRKHSSHYRSDTEDPNARPQTKKFCMLPPKSKSGDRDPTWIRVLMPGWEPVTAHSGIFEQNRSYEMLVGDVSARIEEWVREDMTTRMLEEEGHEEGGFRGTFQRVFS